MPGRLLSFLLSDLCIILFGAGLVAAATHALAIGFPIHAFLLVLVAGLNMGFVAGKGAQ